MTEHSNKGGFLFIMNLKNCCQQHVFSVNINMWNHYLLMYCVLRFLVRKYHSDPSIVSINEWKVINQ